MRLHKLHRRKHHRHAGHERTQGSLFDQPNQDQSDTREFRNEM